MRLIADELMADGVRLEEKRATSDGCITKAVMEKLVELLITSDDYENSVCLSYPCKVCQYKGEDCTYKARADHLIAHGVTVQECCHKAESVISQTGLMCTDCHSDIDRDAVFCKYCGAKVMPQPPKGE